MELLEEQTNLFIVKSKLQKKTYQILKYLPNSALRSWKYLLKMVNANITRHFFHIPEIDRQGDTEAKTLQKTQKVHSIRSVGIPGIVEVRDSYCFCTNCRHGTGPCLN